MSSDYGYPRRVVLIGLGFTGALTACGAEGNSGSSGNTPQPGNSGDPNTFNAADIPVGGGEVFHDRKIVITQPERGQFKAFSARCTHLGCTVARVLNGTIQCPCHGSEFKITDGSVAKGPAKKPLTPKTVTAVKGLLKVT